MMVLACFEELPFDPVQPNGSIERSSHFIGSCILTELLFRKLEVLVV